MGLSEKDLCIRCQKGGKLLVCSDIVCPTAVHEDCLGCPARFDETGNFKCPYCLCRQAIAELCQKRENLMSQKKALSSFIDEEMIDHDKRKQKSANAKAKEQAQSMDCDKQNQKFANAKAKERSELITTVNAVKSSIYDNEKRVDDTHVSSHSVILKDKEEEFAPSSTHKTKSTPIIACGRDDASSEEDTIQHFEIVKVSQGVKEHLSRQVDGLKFVRVVERQQENNNLSDSHVVEEKTTGDYLETHKENESRNAEEEHVQEDEISASSHEDESMPEIHLEAQQGDEGQVRHSKRIKRTDAHKAQSCSDDFSKKSSPVVRKDSTKETGASRKLRKSSESRTNSPRNQFPVGRRTRLLWTEEEEEMLREGVQTFSSTANKNLPWKKILAFGRIVFDSTRTPMDLKDKWRNMLAKQD